MTPVFYTVKEIAKKLDAKEDTVRRWIYDGKLKTDIHSKKGGHMISPEEFVRFLRDHPKYAAKLAGAVPTTPVAIGVFMAGMLGGLMALATSKKETPITADDVKRSMETKIDDLKKQIAKEQARLEALMQEIEAKQATLDRYLMMVDQVDADMIANQINDEFKSKKEMSE